MTPHPLPTLLSLLILSGTENSQQPKPEELTNSIAMKLVRIPAGSFMMGSPRNEEDRDRKEMLHEITISKPFYLGAYEVTQAEYVRVMGNTDDFKNRARFKAGAGGGETHPMENVEWVQANAFCRLLSALPREKAAGRKYRLPTEAEWEYACRGWTKTPYHFGNTLSAQQANFNGTEQTTGSGPGRYARKTVAVGSYQPNAFGLYDMHGNVAEWCSDFYDPDYYENSPEEDPLGPPVGVVPTNFANSRANYFRVVRGGCWIDDARACRSAYRFRAMPNTRYEVIGFRVVCEVPD